MDLTTERVIRRLTAGGYEYMTRVGGALAWTADQDAASRYDVDGIPPAWSVWEAVPAPPFPFHEVEAPSRLAVPYRYDLHEHPYEYVATLSRGFLHSRGTLRSTNSGEESVGTRSGLVTLLTHLQALPRHERPEAVEVRRRVNHELVLMCSVRG